MSISAHIHHCDLSPAPFEEQVITFDRKYQPQRRDIADTANLSHNPGGTMVRPFHLKQRATEAEAQIKTQSEKVQRNSPPAAAEQFGLQMIDLFDFTSTVLQSSVQTSCQEFQTTTSRNL